MRAVFYRLLDEEIGVEPFAHEPAVKVCEAHDHCIDLAFVNELGQCIGGQHALDGRFARSHNDVLSRLLGRRRRVSHASYTLPCRPRVSVQVNILCWK